MQRAEWQLGFPFDPATAEDAEPGARMRRRPQQRRLPLPGIAAEQHEATASAGGRPEQLRDRTLLGRTAEELRGIEASRHPHTL